MPTLSVITPVYDGGDSYLLETYESIASQRLPKGWALQWIVQEDGKTGRPLDRLPNLPWISKSVGRRGGAARARTLALHRADGVLLRAVDADDLLPDDEAIARDIAALSENPDLGWTVSPGCDLLPDGTVVPGPFDPPAGRLPAGFLAATQRAGFVPVLGTTMTIYTELMVALGGWPAIPAYEDVGPLLAAEAVVGGWMQEKIGLIYRKYHTQSTADPEYRDESERTVRMALVLNRADAMREIGWTWRPRKPLG